MRLVHRFPGPLPRSESKEIAPDADVEIAQGMADLYRSGLPHGSHVMENI